jgi:hypothetical protein
LPQALLSSDGHFLSHSRDAPGLWLRCPAAAEPAVCHGTPTCIAGDSVSSHSGGDRAWCGSRHGPSPPRAKPRVCAHSPPGSPESGSLGSGPSAPATGLAPPARPARCSRRSGVAAESSRDCVVQVEYVRLDRLLPGQGQRLPRAIEMPVAEQWGGKDGR